jgi:tyrosine-protein phosphatase YwqE
MNENFPSQWLALQSDDVYAEGIVTSDASSMRRRLLRLEEVKNAAQSLKSSKDFKNFIDFTKKLIAEEHDPSHQHLPRNNYLRLFNYFRRKPPQRN